MKRKITIIVSIILIAIMALALVGCNNKEQPDPPASGLDNWMDCIKDDTPITKLAIPGSHDSGTVGMMSLAETQGATIGDQLMYGTRYFDIRVSANKSGGRIFHGPIKGEPFPPIVDDIASFLESQPSEFLILDFQHFNGKVADKLVLDTLTAKGIMAKSVSNESSMDDREYLDSLTLGDVRGKAIIFFGSDMASEYNNIFRRNNDGCTRQDSSLDSLYIGDDHKKGSEHFLDVAMKKYFDHILAVNSGMLVLQGQLTGGNVRNEEYAHSEAMSTFVRAIKDNKQYLDVVNIVMRDFVEADAEKTLSTLSLNYYKGYVKSASLDSYRSLTKVA